MCLGNLSVNDCSVWVSRNRWNKAIGETNFWNLSYLPERAVMEECPGTSCPCPPVCSPSPSSRGSCTRQQTELRLGPITSSRPEICFTKCTRVLMWEKGMQFSDEKLGCCCPLGDCSYKRVVSITRNGRCALHGASGPPLYPVRLLPALPMYIY